MVEPKRIMQTEFGRLGNCQSACLAMMLGCDLANVPNFALLEGGCGNRMHAAESAWLRDHGVWLLTIVAFQGLPWPPKLGFYIAGGVSPRGMRHAVIYRSGELWHDPHPAGGGIESVDDIDLILPIDFRPALSSLWRKS